MDSKFVGIYLKLLDFWADMTLEFPDYLTQKILPRSWGLRWYLLLLLPRGICHNNVIMWYGTVLFFLNSRSIVQVCVECLFLHLMTLTTSIWRHWQRPFDVKRSYLIPQYPSSQPPTPIFRFVFYVFSSFSSPSFILPFSFKIFLSVILSVSLTHIHLFSNPSWSFPLFAFLPFSFVFRLCVCQNRNLIKTFFIETENINK